MPFTKPLPQWNAVGSEPPQEKKDLGWQPDEKPPADWWNWFQNKVYEALKELQENAATNDQISSLSQNKQDKLGYTPVNKEGDTINGLFTIEYIAPMIVFHETDTGIIYRLVSDGGGFSLRNDSVDSNEWPLFYYQGELKTKGSKIWDVSQLRWNNGKLEYNDGGTWKGAGGVKSVQRGQLNISNAVTQDVTISAVNLSKSFVSFNGFKENARAFLVNSTTLRIINESGNGHNVAWEVIEYA